MFSLSKIIKASKRGLTFSFKESKTFKIGTTYSYVVDKKTNKVHIIPNKNGTLKLSRKKVGNKELPLIDLRNKEVMGLFSDADLLKITIRENDIYVEAYNDSHKESDCSGNLIRIEERVVKKNKIASCIIKKSRLDELRMAVGDAYRYDKWENSISIEDEYSILGDRYSTYHSDFRTSLETVYNVVSLFSGAGIFDYPFASDPQFNFVYAIDYNENACKTYRHNIGNHITCGDVHKVDGTKFKDIHLLISSPSCKPFTNQNRILRLKDHEDSDLVYEHCRITGECNPEIFVLENVPALYTACDGEYYKLIEKELGSGGKYKISPVILNDHECGGYTIRKRFFAIGSRIGSVDIPKLFLKSGFKTVRDAFAKIKPNWSNINDVTSPKKDTAFRMSFVPQGGNWRDIPEEYRTSTGTRHSNTYRRLALDEPSPTLVNWRKPPIIHPTENRILSVAEAKALQGLPGNFDILGSNLDAKQQQVGNCVTVAMGTFIKQIVKNKLNSVHSTRELALT